MRSNLDARHYFYMLPPLSVGAMGLLQDEIGLGFLNWDLVVSEARGAITRESAGFGGLLNGRGRDGVSAAGLSFVNALRSSLDPDAERMLDIWISEIYTLFPWDSPSWFCYQQVFKKLYHRFTMGEDVLSLSNLAAEVYGLYERTVREPNVFGLLDSLRVPSSAWDIFLLDLTGLDPMFADAPRDGHADLYAAVYGTVSRNRFRRFWIELLPILDPKRQSRLHILGDSLLQAYSRRQDRLRVDLPRPAELFAVF